MNFSCKSPSEDDLLGTPSPKERSDKEEENCILNVDLIKEVIDLALCEMIADILLKFNSHLSKVCVRLEYKSVARVALFKSNDVG
ncbi:hypothetical protein TNCV_199511 [Trichonephila clavipes]|nr:hypothetical protein TNCV_199511 [Trichonephila clavipes]